MKKFKKKIKNFKKDALTSKYLLWDSTKINLKKKIKKRLLKLCSKMIIYKKNYRRLSLINNISVKKLGKISIIIPLFNMETKIKKTLSSISKQVYKDYEVIIVDDGSTDNSKNIIKQNKNPKIKYYYKNNEGPGLARNYGLKKATGEYIFFLDADDEIEPFGLESLIIEMSLNNLEVIAGKTFRYNVNTKFYKNWVSSNYKNYFYITNFKASPNILFDTIATNKLYKRNIFQKYYLYFEKGFYEDKLFMALLYDNVDRIGFLNEFSYRWNVYEKNSSITTKKNIENLKSRINKIEDIYENINKKDIKIKYMEVIIKHDFKIYINEFQNYSKEEKKQIYELMSKCLKNKWSYLQNKNLIKKYKYLKYLYLQKKDKFINL